MNLATVHGVLLPIRWKISTIPRRALVSLRYAVLPSIRDSLKTRDDEGADRYVQQQGVGFAWISGRQELSISRHTLAIRRRMYCWNKPSSCSAFPFPPLVPIDTTAIVEAVGFLFKRTPGDILARYQTTVQWTTDSDRIQQFFSLSLSLFQPPLPTNVQNGPTSTRDWGGEAFDSRDFIREVSSRNPKRFKPLIGLSSRSLISFSMHLFFDALFS